MPAQCVRTCGRRSSWPYVVIVPGFMIATGPPLVHRSLVQSCSTYSIGCSAFSPNISANPLSTAAAAGGQGGQAVLLPGRAADEGEQDAGAAVGRAVVERGAHGAVVADPEAVEAVLAPERLVVDRVALHQVAHVHLVEQGRVARRQRRCPTGWRATSSGGAATMTRLQATAPRLVCTTARVLVLVDPRDGGVQRHPRTELARQPQRDQLRAADEAPLLRAVLRVGVALEGALVGLVARAGDVVDDEQQRQLVGVGTEARLGPALEQVHDAVRVDRVAADVVAEGHRVPLLGARVGPGRVDVDLGGPLVELRLQDRRVGEDQRVGRDGAVVLLPTERARGVVDALAVVVLLERRHLELFGQRDDVVLGRTDERAAGLDHRTRRRAGG